MTTTSEPKNQRTGRCTMLDSEIDTIVSALHLILQRSRNAGVDFAEIVWQFLTRCLTESEQSQFCAELKAERQEKRQVAQAGGAF